MNKGMKLFLKIFYYAFGIIAGIILAVVLPQALYNDLPFEYIQNAINEKDYPGAIRLCVGYYDNDIVYQNGDDDKGIVIFASAVLEANEEGVDSAKIKKAYSGFIYGVKKSDSLKLLGENKPTLKAIASDDTSFNYEIINCDADEDEEEIAESIYFLELGYNYLYFSFREEDIKDIKKIELRDNTNSLYYGVSDLNLTFSEQFFIDVDEFVNEYNKDYNSSKLTELDTAFKAKDDSYKMSYNNDIRSKVNTKSCIIIVLYFAFIYILGDCLVGKRYIINAIKKLIQKNKKPSVEPETQEFGYGDYFCQVTYSLVVPSDCAESFLITYSNEKYTVEFPLTKAGGYKVTKRVHAGVYVNAWVEANGYQAIDFPKTIEVKGFNKAFTATFTHKKDNNNEYNEYDVVVEK